MDENWYTNESVWSLSFFYPDPKEDEKKKKSKAKSEVIVRTYQAHTGRYVQDSQLKPTTPHAAKGIKNVQVRTCTLLQVAFHRSWRFPVAATYCRMHGAVKLRCASCDASESLPV